MYRIQIDRFEGPMDLLMFFIQRDELDIHDIPIAQITDDYLSYVRLMQRIDLDGVGDFLYMAALLIGIKTRMLLPREVGPDGAEVEDPRAELVERLVEYIRYREASEHLEALKHIRERFFTLGEANQTTGFASDVVEARQASLFDLVGALRRVLATADPTFHAVQRVNYTVVEQRSYLLSLLPTTEKLGFVSLMKAKTKPFIIASFLAVLELAKDGFIFVTTAGGPDDFWISARKPLAEA
jgi:segregation and condensation protein A